MTERLAEDTFAALDEQTVVARGTQAAALTVPSLAGPLAAILDSAKTWPTDRGTPGQPPTFDRVTSIRRQLQAPLDQGSLPQDETSRRRHRRRSPPEGSAKSDDLVCFTHRPCPFRGTRREQSIEQWILFQKKNREQFDHCKIITSPCLTWSVSAEPNKARPGIWIGFTREPEAMVSIWIRGPCEQSTGFWIENVWAGTRPNFVNLSKSSPNLSRVIFDHADKSAAINAPTAPPTDQRGEDSQFIGDLPRRKCFTKLQIVLRQIYANFGTDGWPRNRDATSNWRRLQL